MGVVATTSSFEACRRRSQGTSHATGFTKRSASSRDSRLVNATTFCPRRCGGGGPRSKRSEPSRSISTQLPLASRCGTSKKFVCHGRNPPGDPAGRLGRDGRPGDPGVGRTHVSVVGRDPSPEEVAWVEANQPDMRTLSGRAAAIFRTWPIRVALPSSSPRRAPGSARAPKGRFHDVR